MGPELSTGVLYFTLFDVGNLARAAADLVPGPRLALTGEKPHGLGGKISGRI